MRLTQKVLLMSIVPMLVGGLWIGFKSSYATRDMALTALNQYAEDMLELQATNVAHVFGNAVRDLTYIAAQAPMQTGERSTILRYLKETYPVYASRFMGLYWVELEGNVFGQDDVRFKNSDRYFYPNFRRGEVVISKTIVDKDSNTPTVVVLVPVFDKSGKHVGGLSATVGVYRLIQTLVMKKLAFDGFSVLIDSDQKVLSNRLRENEKLLQEGFQPLEQRSNDFQNFVTAVKDTHKHLKIKIDEVTINGETYFVYHRLLPPSDWTIATLFPRKALMKPMQKMQFTTVGIILCSALASLFLMALLRQIIIRPMNNLVASYRRVANNDLGARSTVKSKDEWGELARSFNRMADSLERLHHQQILTELDLRRAKEKAEEASAQKSEFITTMSKELRMPLQGIVESADRMDAVNQDEEIAGYIHIVRNSSDALTRLINNIFDISKTNSGNMELAYASFNLREMLEDSLQLMRPRALQKKLATHFSYSEELSDFYWGDSDRLRQVMRA